MLKLIVGLFFVCLNSCGKKQERVEAEGAPSEAGLAGSWQGIRSEYAPQTQLKSNEQMIELSFHTDGAFDIQFKAQENAKVKGSYSAFDDGKLYLDYAESNVSSFRAGGRPHVWTYEQIGDELNLLQTVDGGTQMWTYVLKRILTQGKDPLGSSEIDESLLGVCFGRASSRGLELQTLSNGDFILRVQSPGQSLAIFNGKGKMVSEKVAKYTIEKSTSQLGGDLEIEEASEDNHLAVSLKFSGKPPLNYTCEFL